jgi:hypothetical protein
MRKIKLEQIQRIKRKRRKQVRRLRESEGFVRVTPIYIYPKQTNPDRSFHQQLRIVCTIYSYPSSLIPAQSSPLHIFIELSQILITLQNYNHIKIILLCINLLIFNSISIHGH